MRLGGGGERQLIRMKSSPMFVYCVDDSTAVPSGICGSMYHSYSKAEA